MNVVYLSGGVGGARLLDGLAQIADNLVVVVNTGDDLRHWGLYICPDVDTVIYTLAKESDVQRGWGLKDESFRALEMIGRYGGDTWFRLGDRDLATHVFRTEALAQGRTLTDITAQMAHALGVRVPILPMCDHPRPTRIETVDGRTLPFQDWLVREAAPEVRAIRFEGSQEPTTQVLSAIRSADAIIIGPSNPFVSIDPILSLDGITEAVFAKPVVAVSPIVHGRAIKGPLASMFPHLSHRPASARAIADHYPGPVSLVVERKDEVGLTCRFLATSTVMRSPEDRLCLAREVLAFTERLL